MRIPVGVAPYTGENSNLLKEFSTTLFPDKTYELTMDMDDTGLTNFGLFDADLSSELEKQSVQHDNMCTDNFYEGTVDGLYFGGTCEAPEDVVVTYYSSTSPPAVYLHRGVTGDKLWQTAYDDIHI